MTLTDSYLKELLFYNNEAYIFIKEVDDGLLVKRLLYNPDTDCVDVETPEEGNEATMPLTPIFEDRRPFFGEKILILPKTNPRRNEIYLAREIPKDKIVKLYEHETMEWSYK